MKSIIKKNQTREPSAGEVGARAPSTQRSGCEQTVRLLSEGGLVHAIEVTCRCGQVTVVELEYPEGPEAPR